jgi:hypothetical protein
VKDSEASRKLADQAKKVCDLRTKSFFLPRLYLVSVRDYIDKIEEGMDFEFRLLRDFVDDNKGSFVNNLYYPIGYIAKRDIKPADSKTSVPHYFTIFNQRMSFLELSQKDSSLCLELLKSKDSELYAKLIEKAVFGADKAFKQTNFASLFREEAASLTENIAGENQDQYLADLDQLKKAEVKVLLVCNDPVNSDRRWYYATTLTFKISAFVQYILYEKKDLE